MILFIFLFPEKNILFTFAILNIENQKKTKKMKKLTLLISILVAIKFASALNPSKEYKVLPDEYGMTYKEITIETDDKTRLNTWYFTPKNESKKLMIISDDGEGNMADNLAIVAQFISMGYNVVTYDYRGYGKSDDFKINPEFFIYAQFAQDLIAVINYNHKFHAVMTIDLYGIGIGAGLSLSVGSSRPEPRKVIADAPYLNLENMQKKYKNILEKEVKMPLMYDKFLLEPTYALPEKGKHLNGIMYIIGEKDKLITPDDVKQLYKLNGSKATMYIVKGVANDENFSMDKNEYFNQIKKFLEKS